jgi:TolA-binding protein
MKTRTTLAASAALGVFVAVGLGSAAAAATTKHHHRPARHREPGEVTELKQEVEALKGQVESLEGRLDAQAQAQQQTAAQVQAAQTQAQAAQTQAQVAQTQAQAAQTQIATIPSEMEESIKAHAPKPGWWNNTTVGGTVFADASYISNSNDGVRNAQSGADYDIKRAYLIVNHKFNDTWQANFTTDFTYDSTTKATQLYIKKAYLEADLNPAFIIRAGAADLPWVPFVEDLYGYRYVERSLPDLYGYGTSADWGIHVLGHLFNNIVGYQVSVIDGSGYKVPATGTANRTDAVDVEGRISANYDHIVVAVGGYDGKLGHDVTGTPTFHTAERFDATLAYKDSRITVGGEYLWARYWNDVLQSNPAKTNSTELWSGYASFRFTPQFSIFGRYDWAKPQVDTNPNLTSNYYNFGVSYKPIPPLDIALVYKHDSVMDGLLSTQNGSIGTLNANDIGRGTYNEVGVFTQVKF